ncbi:NUDIX hydrolase [Halarcobacter ebronensis]|uniref:Coenzyme A pyrophosphatase n=1 Tax=Halarcobacter ebronensis TaxID=1462615 RepID=A0A4Q1APN9_9BACT|nr:CoA pyrophosphatase [Halarcobacter ebronensis]QKF82781.1 coenzyme A pyrophosphatase [Halarcobacter ebronensis]RXK06805.1 coenzyme A pyrophosphatase [Halarcobacter ebronensis]
MKKSEFKKLIKSLPKYPNVMARDRYLNSAVLIPIIKIDKKFYILFQKRAENIRQGGDICFPGGRFEEEDITFENTAIRETYEELGIKKRDIKIFGQLDTYVAPIGAVVEPFVARVKKRALKSMKIDKNEVEKTLLVPIEFFKNNPAVEYTLKYEVHPYSIDKDGNKEIHFPVQELNLPKTYHKPWGHKRHKVWVYNYKGEVIWGLTAVIINELLKKFK